jgi:hypothetical protein
MTCKVSVTSLALSAVLALVACSELLVEEPKGFTTTDTFFKDGRDLNIGTIAIYNALRGIQGQAQWTTPELASDVTRADNREPNATTYGPDRLNWDAATGLTGGYWTSMYPVITRANLVLANGPGIESPNQQMKDRNIAEAKFLRGYAYLWLTKAYDDVPLLLSPEEQANPSPTRTPVEQVHQAVIQDLTEADAALPLIWEANDGFGIATQGGTGRATKGAAQMALADLYLWRSSFMNKNEWQQASDWAKRVIDDVTWSLNNNYLNTFRPQFKGNREMILYVTNSGVTTNVRSLFQLFYYPRDWGLDQGQGGGWGLIHPTDWFYNSYIPGDYRRSTGSGFTTDSAYVNGGCSVSGLPSGCSASSSFGDGVMPYKYKKSDNGANWTLNDVDTPLYRLAEAILIYAEAQNELNNTTVAVQYLNLIRARARRGTGSQSRTEPHDYGTGAGEAITQAAVRDAIYMERAWEFAFEGKRWFDLVRRDTQEPGFWQTSLQAHDPNASRSGPIAAHKKRFPIPQTQIDANPSLTQNPGY